MKRNSGCGCVFGIIFGVLLISGLVSHTIIIAPIFLFIVTFLIVKGVKDKKEAEERARKKAEEEARERERRQREAQAHDQEARRQYEARKQREAQAREEEARRQQEARKEWERKNQYQEFWAKANDYQKSRMNSVITCEYCGSRVDTDKYACCNSCGGPYWDNEEWKRIQNYRKGA